MRGTSRSASQPELKWLTTWLSFLWESESPWRVDDVHDRSLRDSLSPCCAAAHSQSLLWLNIMPPSVSDSSPLGVTVRFRACEFGTVSVSSCGK